MAASAAVDADAMGPASRTSAPPLSPARTAALTTSLAEAVEAAAARMAETARLAATARRADASAAPGFPHLPLAAARDSDGASQRHTEAPPPGATLSPLGSALGLASPETAQGIQSPFRLGPDALIPPAFARPGTGERGPQSPFADPEPMTSGADRPRLSPMLTVVEPPAAAQGTNHNAEPADVQPLSALQPADAWPREQPPGDCTTALPPAAEPLATTQPHPDSPSAPATPLFARMSSTSGTLTSTSTSPLAVPDRLGAPQTTLASPVTPEQQTTDQTNPAQPEPFMDARPLRQLLREAIRDEMRGEIGQQIDTELRRVVREELAAALTEAFGRDLR
ncbi:hypothetical protein [Paracoccus sanguinis]|uniref:hypothetical protein n=1 Tax=Paracoccus sanguinis TaxID=1545044 RepID=UPI0014512E09|nr:hypothetical protein [Paracoccus sanguinis]QJD16380.1 hypothetical protein HGN31_05340 [Paracoccus sanguinis]